LPERKKKPPAKSTRGNAQRVIERSYFALFAARYFLAAAVIE
jgi:hypothetical protein